MNFTDWEPIYHKIITDFSYSEIEDRNSAIILEELLQHHPHTLPLSSLSSLLSKKTIYVVGASNHISDLIPQYKNKLSNNICICADGVTSLLLHHSILPDIIVTDLDGRINDQIIANQKGSIILVHAHGDNKEILKEIVPQIPQKIIGTTQCDTFVFSHVYNIGGFTDGDRGVFLADHFNAQSINLLGFDFHGPIGKFSDPYHTKNLQIKKKKLLWAEQLINILKKNNRIHFLS